jgi:HPt (histidine-containing phosphotransfer) domain-containing protein
MSADAVPVPALDPATIAELQRAQQEYGNPEFIAQLVALFRANAPARLAHIRGAVAARDGATLGHVSHTLKSNCGMLGALRLAEICARLEAYGDAAASEDAAALVDDAEAELVRVLRELEELCRRPA